MKHASNVDDKPLVVDQHWNDAKPDAIPPPTYWPAVMAFGLTLLAWSALASPVMTVLGLGFLVASVIGWVRELYND